MVPRERRTETLVKPLYGWYQTGVGSQPSARFERPVSVQGTETRSSAAMPVLRDTLHGCLFNFVISWSLNVIPDLSRRQGGPRSGNPEPDEK